MAVTSEMWTRVHICPWATGGAVGSWTSWTWTTTMKRLIAIFAQYSLGSISEFRSLLEVPLGFRGVTK